MARFRSLGCTAAVVVAVAGCGGAGGSGGASPGSGSLVGVAVCMRAHGVSDFSDPGASTSGGAAQGVALIPPGVDTSTPSFKAGWSVCKKLLPGLGGHAKASALAARQLLTFSECMRAHGVSGFPDPTPNPPRSMDGFSGMIRRGGVFLAIPESIDHRTPVYERATSACRFGPVFS